MCCGRHRPASWTHRLAVGSCRALEVRRPTGMWSGPGVGGQGQVKVALLVAWVKRISRSENLEKVDHRVFARVWIEAAVPSAAFAVPPRSASATTRSLGDGGCIPYLSLNPALSARPHFSTGAGGEYSPGADLG
jgi:hypothetical protein